MSGVKLDAGRVKQARQEEMRYFRKKGVYKKIPRAEAKKNGWPIVKVRWIDVNKGDEDNPNYRSRLVAKEFKGGAESDWDLFAGTPPLEALKMLISEAATVADGGGKKKSMLIADVSRAFFEAKARRNVCVELVDEDLIDGENADDLVGHLHLSMYGTRDAAYNWQEEVASTLKRWGFRRGRFNPCTYFHEQLDIKALVHGDDFVAVASAKSLSWFQKELEQRFEIKSARLGTGKDDEREAKVLNRVIRVTDSGWMYETDQRHAELLVEAFDLQEARPVCTPGEDLKSWEVEVDSAELNEADSSSFRKLVARANYLALDRADIQFAVKDLCRAMSKPRVGDMKKLKRLARYLLGKPRMIQQYEWQGVVQEVEVFGDSDWAGCKDSGKSTSGGAIFLGSHVIKTWSRSQKTVALSSGEAELIAMVKATAEGLGILSLAQDWKLDKTLIVLADSTAALGIVKRKGAGKLRHINVGMLWIQNLQEEEKIRYEKVFGPQNPADLMTKNVGGALLEEHCRRLRLLAEEGRAAKASKVSRGVFSSACRQRRSWIDFKSYFQMNEH
ncbi:reverse transcriptase domain-containing protein [bacterium]|nr:reverse transcriptase domain-containing protein [bacterium]